MSDERPDRPPEPSDRPEADRPKQGRPDDGAPSDRQAGSGGGNQGQPSGPPRGDRPQGDHPPGQRPYGNKPGGGRPYGGKPAGGRSYGNKPGGGKPYGNKAYGNKPYGNRPGGPPRGDRPYGDRPQRPYGDRPSRPDGDRPYAGRPRDDRGPRPDGDRQRPDGPRGDGPPQHDRRVDFSHQQRRGPRPQRGPWDRDRGPRRPRGDWEQRDRHAPRPPQAPAPAEMLGEEEEVVAGRRPVEEAFAARREAKRLLVVPERRAALDQLVLHATTLRIPVVEVEGGTITAVTGFDGHQGVALVVAPRRWATLDEVLALAKKRKEPAFLLALDHLEDPQNVGTLLRSAEACGVHGVIFPTRGAAPISPAAIKTSAGAVEHLLLVPMPDLAAGLVDLHARGVRVIGADGDASMTVREADMRGPVCVVTGSEGRGLNAKVRKRVDLMARIPMRGKVASLNASVAGSIFLFEAAAQRDLPETAPAPGDEVAIEAVDVLVAEEPAEAFTETAAAAAGDGAPLEAGTDEAPIVGAAEPQLEPQPQPEPEPQPQPELEPTTAAEPSLESVPEAAAEAATVLEAEADDLLPEGPPPPPEPSR